MGDTAPPVIEIDSWCRTTSGEKASTTFTWTVEDFLNHTEQNQEFIESSSFTISGPNDKVTKWALSLYPNEDIDDEGPDMLGLYLSSKNNSYEKVSLSLSILTERHQKEIIEFMTPARYKEFFDEDYGAIGQSAVVTKWKLDSCLQSHSVWT